MLWVARVVSSLYSRRRRRHTDTFHPYRLSPRGSVFSRISLSRPSMGARIVQRARGDARCRKFVPPRGRSSRRTPRALSLAVDSTNHLVFRIQLERHHGKVVGHFGQFFTRRGVSPWSAPCGTDASPRFADRRWTPAGELTSRCSFSPLSIFLRALRRRTTRTGRRRSYAFFSVSASSFSASTSRFASSTLTRGFPGGVQMLHDDSRRCADRKSTSYPRDFAASKYGDASACCLLGATM